MTQKELAYVEDAIGHEANIIKICQDIINNLSDQEIITFMKNEVEKHTTRKESLMSLLEVKTNE